jgi:hypothetical protein
MARDCAEKHGSRRIFGKVLLSRVGAIVLFSALFGNENSAARATGISTEGAQEMQKAGSVFLCGLALSRSGL